MQLPPRLAPAAAAVAAAAAISAAAAESALRLGSGFVDRQSAAAHLILIELGSGLLCFLVGGHLDESEPARTTRGRIAHHTNRFHVAGAAEQLLQLRFTRRIWQISDVQPSTHHCLLARRSAGTTRHSAVTTIARRWRLVGSAGAWREERVGNEGSIGSRRGRSRRG